MYKLPEYLIYNPKNSHIYRMFNTKSGKHTGTMYAFPSYLNQTFIVHELLVNKNYRRQGIGTAFLNFAKRLSFLHGYEGRMRVCATTLPFDPVNPPHIFYRKYGFTTDNKERLKTIDQAIKKGKQLDPKTTFPLFMDYPGEKAKYKHPSPNVLKNTAKITYKFIKKMIYKLSKNH